MQRRVIPLFYFALAVGLFVAALMLLNRLPSALQEGSLKRFEDVDAVKKSLRIGRIFVPSYFPQDLSWPPSVVLAQIRPFHAVIMEFRRKESECAALIITQSASAKFEGLAQIKIEKTLERVSYPLKGRTALLEVGSCHGGDPCSRISWDEGAYRIGLMMKSPPFELIKIAESMIH